MSTATFTPGPWCREAVMHERDYDICLDYEIPSAGSPIVVASVDDDEDDGDTGPITRAQARGNAMLIAAAPDLYAACKAAIEATGGSVHWNGLTKAFLELCESAVAKVEGIAKATPPLPPSE